MFNQGDYLQGALERIMELADDFKSGLVGQGYTERTMLRILTELKSSVMTEAAFTMD
jgi:hypothetical protein